jgi:hypothetical protein
LIEQFAPTFSRSSQEPSIPCAGDRVFHLSNRLDPVENRKCVRPKDFGFDVNAIVCEGFVGAAFRVFESPAEQEQFASLYLRLRDVGQQIGGAHRFPKGARRIAELKVLESH